MDQATIKERLRDWILRHAKEPVDADALEDSTPVVEAGFLSSLDIVEFVLYLESLRDAEIDVEALEPQVFTSIDTIFQTFFVEGAA